MNLKEKLVNLLNVHPDSNQRWLLLSASVCSLLYTYTSATFTKTVVSALPAQWLAFEALFSSIVALIIGMAWKGNFRKSVIKHFLGFCIIESLCGCFLGFWLCFVKWNVWVYAIASLIYTNLITILVGKAIMAFRARLWNDKAKEIYDNNNSIVGGICCIVGFAMSLFALPSLKLSLFLWGLCCIIDDLGWIIVYVKNKTWFESIDYDKD